MPNEFNRDARFLCQISEDQSVCLNIVVVIVPIIHKLLKLLALLLGLDNVADLSQQDLLHRGLESVLRLVKPLRQTKLPLTNSHDLIQIIDVIDVAYLGYLALV